MLITRIRIADFRCIASLDFEASPTTVIIGENNAGKTAVLDAIKLALGRRWGRSGATGFTEFDFRRATRDGQLVYLPISIELFFSESADAPWSQDLKNSLNDVIVTGLDGRDYIHLKVSCRFEDVTKSVEPEWMFLNEDAQPFKGRGSRNQNLSDFFDYAPCFSMSAMRDASVEFGGRSRFWGGLLKTIEIDPAKTADLEARFANLNDELISADPKLEAVKNTLREISSVIAKGAAGDVDVRAVSASLWEIISKSELVLRGGDTEPWLPVIRHGHGVQSLAVLFLFKAFVEASASGAIPKGGEPILTLEEPEAHLHPQAIRSLWEAIRQSPGQTFITTHSPYFVQNVPLGDLLILRRGAEGPKAHKVPAAFSAPLLINAELKVAVQKSDILSLDETAGTLHCFAPIQEGLARDLMRCFVNPPHHATHHATIRELQKRSVAIVDAVTLSKLESWAKRIRGEIFFAKGWILCEGQAEYAVLSALFEHAGWPLDSHGVALIDYQNNGAPGAFAALARALDFPWIMICDGDQGGDDHIKQLSSFSFTPEEIATRVIQLSAGADLEQMIIDSPLRDLYRDAILELAPLVPDDNAALLTFARNSKEETAVRFARLVRTAARRELPAPIDSLIKAVTGWNIHE